MKKIVSVVGARPQFIKLAPLSGLLRARFREVIVHTGQHYDPAMSGDFFTELGIAPPRYNLGIGSDGGRGHGEQIGRMLIRLEEVFGGENPDLVMVFGDTNSTLAGALGAAKRHIPVLHVEAGLRSFNRSMPEELNRVATDHLSDFLFAPTPTALENLAREGLAERTHLTGDIMVDTLKQDLEKALADSDVLERLGLAGKDFMLLTLHRPYNVDDPARMARLLDLLSRLHSPIVFPVHPRSKKIMEDHHISFGDSIKAIEPVGHGDFVCLAFHSRKIITDSGGVQKEAYILKRPCITLRPETEWVETVLEGWNLLLTPERQDFVEAIEAFEPPPVQTDIFGREVAQKMVRLIETFI